MLCVNCNSGAHEWGEHEDDRFPELTLHRWWCVCPLCPECPALAVTVDTALSWYGQHRFA